MSFSTKARLFYGVNIEIPDGVEWETLDDDTNDGIKMIHYGSDGDSMYAVAVADSVATVKLDAVAPAVSTDAHASWRASVERFCEKHGLTCNLPAWRLAVERF
jgi:hypothetical protein